MSEYDQIAFGWLASAHPHDAYAAYPERFWDYFQKECPGVTRDEMERMLREDEEKGGIDERVS